MSLCCSFVVQRNSLSFPIYLRAVRAGLTPNPSGAGAVDYEGNRSRSSRFRMARCPSETALGLQTRVKDSQTSPAFCCRTLQGQEIDRFYSQAMSTSFPVLRINNRPDQSHLRNAILLRQDAMAESLPQGDKNVSLSESSIAAPTGRDYCSQLAAMVGSQRNPCCAADTLHLSHCTLPVIRLPGHLRSPFCNLAAFTYFT